MFRQILLSFLLILTLGNLSAQSPKKTLQALKIENSQKPKIDGILDENIWLENQNKQKDFFIQNVPNNGENASFPTEIHLAYDDFSIYIAARLYDDNPDSIQTQLSQRDNIDVNADRFGVVLDTYNSGQNAFVFVVTSAGVQGDYFVNIDDWDENWNAVWKSAVKIDEQGWVIEFEIPYLNLRFPKKDIQTWGINFGRFIQRKQEDAFWNFIDRNVNGFVNQAGKLEGIKGIEPPLRLSFTPYVSAYYEADGNNNSSGQRFNGGMDLKYGINESFTLDMSLIPDFGQVQSDNLVLNLSPFEVRFQENRPFFTEGTELFNRLGLFYSRRVGQSFGINGKLEENEYLTETPASAPLVNATKISGRTQNGLGIGFFNAITRRTEATVRNSETNEERQILADPLTNFNVFVLDQNLKNNSNIGIINTNVTRGKNAPSANVTGANFRLFDIKNKYRVAADLEVSQIYEMSNENGKQENDVGYAYGLIFGKVSGRFQYNFVRRVESDNYNINDLGFLRAPNEVTHRMSLSYQINEPFWKLNSFRSSIDISHQQTFEPREYDEFRINLNVNVRTKKFWNFGSFAGIRPIEANDHFQARHTGYTFRKPENFNLGMFMGTDSRKKFAINGDIGIWTRPQWNQFDNWFSVSPRLIINDKLSFSLNTNFQKRRKEVGYATSLYDSLGNLDEIIFGRRFVQNLTNTFFTSYTFNETMGLTFRLRHYWSKVEYVKFFELKQDGHIYDTNFDGFDENGNQTQNANFNAFNIDLVYNWVFQPGSLISIVWKNSILTNSFDTSPDYFQNINNTFESPALNSISIRVLYFLNYHSLKKLI